MANSIGEYVNNKFWKKKCGNGQAWYGAHTATVANSAKNCLARFQKKVPHAAMGCPSPIQIHY